MTSPTYYIYLHRRLDTDEVFYVGKGTRTPRKGYRRGFDAKWRSQAWLAVARTSGHGVDLVADFFDERDAFEYERHLIALYGRSDKGTGILVNMTNGGQGMSGSMQSQATIQKRSNKLRGRLVSPETRERISRSLRGANNPRYGQHWPAEIRLKQSIGNKGKKIGGKSTSAKAVLDTASSTVFPSTRDAANHLGVPMSTLAHKLCGQRRNDTSMRYA